MRRSVCLSDSFAEWMNLEGELKGGLFKFAKVLSLLDFQWGKMNFMKIHDPQVGHSSGELGYGKITSGLIIRDWRLTFNYGILSK